MTVTAHLRHQSCPNYYGRSTRQAERLSSLYRHRQENVGVATTTTNAGWRAGPQRAECRPAGGTGWPPDRDRPTPGPGPPRSPADRGPAGRPGDAPTSGVVSAADRCQPVAL